MEAITSLGIMWLLMMCTASGIFDAKSKKAITEYNMFDWLWNDHPVLFTLLGYVCFVMFIFFVMWATGVFDYVPVN